jgi:hypothetical protein
MSNTKQSQQQGIRKEAQKHNWVEEIKKSFNKNRTKRIVVA